MNDNAPSDMTTGSDLSGKMTAIEKYLRRGWALVPLHYITSAGLCSCGNPECRSAGKHPIMARWQADVMRTSVSWEPQVGVPQLNIGIATGVPSGFWVLDYDPANTSDAAERLIDSIAFHWPAQVQTGGRGLHWRFEMPADFEVTNRRGTLPAGLDVRGTGGQVVAPPSVSGKGAYVELPTPGDGMPYAPPTWLLDMIRPTAPLPRGEPPAGWSPVPTPGPLSASGDDRGQRYARAAVDDMLAELAATPSNRNDLAFRCACRIIEMANAGWLSAPACAEAWDSATLAHPLGVAVPQSEADAIWRSAQRTVGDRPAELPPEWTDPLRIEVWPTPPVDAAGVPPFSALSPNEASGYRVPAFSEPGITSPSPNGGSPYPSVPLTSGAASTPTDPVQALIDQMLTVEQLRLMPPPEPLITGILDIDTTTWLIGASESYKSFVALDIAAHVGRGEKWRGRWTRQGLVVIVVAEGARGMRLRVDAFEREYGPIENVRFLPRPIQADERKRQGEWTLLVHALHRLRPVLVIIDTQARVTVGMDENGSTDMGVYVEQADRIKRATAACVLTVHHLGRNGTHARGSNAIDGAQDSELRLNRVSDLLTELHVDKQKDLARDAPIRLALVRSEGGTDPVTGRDLSSLVISRDEPPAARVGETEDLTGHAATLGGECATFANSGNGQTKAVIQARLVADLKLMSRATFYRAWNEAIERKILCKVYERDSWRYVPPERREFVIEGVGANESGQPRYWIFPDATQE